MKLFRIELLVFSFFVIVMSGCSPEVGSEAWCKKLSEKPKGEWTANETGEYAKSCLLR